MAIPFEKNLEILRQMLYNDLYSVAFKERFRMKDRDFTRHRKLDFSDLSLLILEGRGTGITRNVMTYLREAQSPIDSYSAAAFCKARQKIKWEAFEKLFHDSGTVLYSSNDYKKLNGYRLLAIDGSDFNLPNTNEVLEVFGSESFSNGTQPQALVSCLYDVLNHILIDAKIGRYDANERDLAEKHLEYLDSFRTVKDIIIMDRGYPSSKLISVLEDKKYYYLFRANKDNFFRELRDTNLPDQVVVREEKDGTKLKFRVINIPLEDGRTETLITNLFSESLTAAFFAKLYHYRWEIETRYDVLKNMLNVEDFSGNLPICIYQDIYATMYLTNFLAIMEFDNQDLLDEYNSIEGHQYLYNWNTAMCIYALKNSFIELVLTSSSQKRDRLYNRIRNEMAAQFSPVRNGRSYPRKKKYHCSKYSSNSKPI